MSNNVISYPNSAGYKDLMQNHSVVLFDAELKKGKVKTDKLGLPFTCSGNFAVVFEINCGFNTYALRCFRNYSANREHRLKEISKTISRLKSSYFVDYSYQEKGIRSYEQKEFPVVKMKWVKGTTLQQFLDKNYTNPNRLKNLQQSFCNLDNFLSAHNIAHCDISMNNVMVCDEEGKKIALIDYDGMFVPSLKSLKHTEELGSPHFQHPKRTANNWYSGLDRFSFHMINLSLFVLQNDPSFYQQNEQEAILFFPSDYKNPKSSEVFKKLLKNKKFKEIAKEFIGICEIDDIEKLPKTNWLLGANTNTIIAKFDEKPEKPEKPKKPEKPDNTTILKEILEKRRNANSGTTRSSSNSGDTSGTRSSETSNGGDTSGTSDSETNVSKFRRMTKIFSIIVLLCLLLGGGFETYKHIQEKQQFQEEWKEIEKEAQLRAAEQQIATVVVPQKTQEPPSPPPIPELKPKNATQTNNQGSNIARSEIVKNLIGSTVCIRKTPVYYNDKCNPSNGKNAYGGIKGMERVTILQRGIEDGGGDDIIWAKVKYTGQYYNENSEGIAISTDVKNLIGYVSEKYINW